MRAASGGGRGATRDENERPDDRTHYGALFDGAHAGIAGRLDRRLEAELEQAAEGEVAAAEE